MLTQTSPASKTHEANSNLNVLTETTALHDSDRLPVWLRVPCLLVALLCLVLTVNLLWLGLVGLTLLWSAPANFSRKEPGQEGTTQLSGALKSNAVYWRPMRLEVWTHATRCTQFCRDVPMTWCGRSAFQKEHVVNKGNYDSFLTIHPVTPEDKAAMAAMRAAVEPIKGRLQGTAARGPFDGIMGRVVAPTGVTFQPDSVGGVTGFWCRPTNAHSGGAILHLHGGWFNWGSAQAFCHLVGHIAARTGAEAFIPDYRLAPEHPFPAAVDDVHACYHGLANRGTRRIAVTGDSAGGCLALVLLSLAAEEGSGVMPVGAVALSPITDLTLTAPSWETRAVVEPYFTHPQALGLVRAYLGNAAPTDPLASPLYGNLSGLPPIRVHVGNDEVLLDDSRQYVERAVAAGVDAKLDVWEGMPHGFLGSIGNFNAAAQALDAIGAFLMERLATNEI
jgi:epsilon-lactone hydrolase